LIDLLNENKAGSFYTQIKMDSKSIYLGTYKTYEEAKKILDDKRSELISNLLL
jgi:hypothetical protein